MWAPGGSCAKGRAQVPGYYTAWAGMAVGELSSFPAVQVGTVFTLACKVVSLPKTTIP